MGIVIFSMFLFFACLVMAYLTIPVFLFRLLSRRWGTSRVFRWISPLIAGALMGIYCFIGVALAVKLLGSGGNLLAYSYPGDPFHIGMPISGAISGVFLQSGISYKTKAEKALFVIGFAILVLMAIFTAFLAMAPE